MSTSLLAFFLGTGLLLPPLLPALPTERHAPPRPPLPLPLLVPGSSLSSSPLFWTGGRTGEQVVRIRRGGGRRWEKERKERKKKHAFCFHDQHYSTVVVCHEKHQCYS